MQGKQHASLYIRFVSRDGRQPSDRRRSNFLTVMENKQHALPTDLQMQIITINELHIKGEAKEDLIFEMSMTITIDVGCV